MAKTDGYFARRRTATLTAMYRPEIVVTQADGYPVMVAEVNNLSDWTRAEAAEFRRNLYAAGGFPRVPYFLLLSQDQGFLWRNGTDDTMREPDAEFPMEDVFHTYVRRRGDARVSGAFLKTVIERWLTDLAYGATRGSTPAEGALAKWGAAAAVAGGRVLADTDAGLPWSFTPSRISS